MIVTEEEHKKMTVQEVIITVLMKFWITLQNII